MEGEQVQYHNLANKWDSSAGSKDMGRQSVATQPFLPSLQKA